MIGGGLVSAVAVTLVVFFLLGQRGTRSFGPDHCPEDGGFAGQFAILVDPSDSLTTVQQSVAPRILEVIEADAAETTEIRVYALAQVGRGDTASVFRACVPPHPDGVSSMTGNPRIAARRYEEFQASLQESLSAVLNDGVDDVSPLIEGIQVSVVNAFQPRMSTMPRQLLIVSDMLQHSGAVSFYGGERPDFGDLSRNPDYGTMRVDLSGVEVSVFLLARGGEAGRAQGDSMRRFWEDYFLDQRAHPTARPRWVAVEG
jgi:hypothetical protein